MSISVHPDLEAELLARASEGGVSVDVYLERLLHDEDAEIAHTEALLREAAESGPHIELTQNEWDSIQQEALSEIATRKQSSL